MDIQSPHKGLSNFVNIYRFLQNYIQKLENGKRGRVIRFYKKNFGSYFRTLKIGIKKRIFKKLSRFKFYKLMRN